MDQGSTSQPTTNDGAARRAIRAENAAKRTQEADKLKLQVMYLLKKIHLLLTLIQSGGTRGMNSSGKATMWGLPTYMLRLSIFMDPSRFSCPIWLRLISSLTCKCLHLRFGHTVNFLLKVWRGGMGLYYLSRIRSHCYEIQVSSSRSPKEFKPFRSGKERQVHSWSITKLSFV